MKKQINRSQSQLTMALLAITIVAGLTATEAVCQQPAAAPPSREAVTKILEKAASAAGFAIDPNSVSIHTSGNSLSAVGLRPERPPLSASELAKGVKVGIVYFSGDRSFVATVASLRLPRLATLELFSTPGESIPSARLVDENKHAVLRIKGVLSGAGSPDRTPRALCKAVPAGSCPSPADRIPDALGIECFTDRQHSVTYAICGSFEPDQASAFALPAISW